MSDDAEIKLVRASGLHWISHKISAMNRILPKFGVFSSHLIALAEDNLSTLLMEISFVDKALNA